MHVILHIHYPRKVLAGANPYGDGYSGQREAFNHPCHRCRGIFSLCRTDNHDNRCRYKARDEVFKVPEFGIPVVAGQVCPQVYFCERVIQVSQYIVKEILRLKFFLEPQYLLNNISRNLNHSLTKVNLRADLPRDNRNAEFRNFEDFIPRFITASVIMVVGAAKGEDPSAAMAWMVEGFPLTTVAVPVWVSAGKNLPWVVKMKDDMHAPLCDAAMKLKGQLFPISRGSGSKYINVAALINADNTGIMQFLEPVENEIFKKTAELMASMPAGKARNEKIQAHYDWLDGYIRQSYRELFGIELK